MPEPDNLAKNTKNRKTGSAGQPDQFLLLIDKYRRTIEKLSSLLMSKSWREFKGDSTVISTVESQLRDTIANLEKFRGRIIGNGVSIDDVLKPLNAALIALYTALDMADVGNPSCYTEFVKCRDNLYVASCVMPSGGG